MRLLDLCCGAGLAAWGYWRTGYFSEVIGVDIAPMPYAFDFVLGDALTLDYDFLSMFDFIHASPPCQYYSKATPDRNKHPRLIPSFHRMLIASGKPYVIENVEGSGHDLRPNLVLSGDDVDLPITRRRYFHLSFMSSCAAPHISSAPGSHISNVPVAHKMSTRINAKVVIHGGNIDKATLINAMGLQGIPRVHLAKMTIKHIEQGVPPAMTARIASMFTRSKFMIGA